MRQRPSNQKLSWDCFVPHRTSLKTSRTSNLCSRNPLQIKVRLRTRSLFFLPKLLTVFTDDELIPRDGKDETYDEVMAEIEELEQELGGALKKFEKILGYIFLCSSISTIFLITSQS